MRTAHLLATAALTWPCLAAQTTLTPAESHAFELKAHAEYGRALDAFLAIAADATPADETSPSRATLAALMARLMVHRAGAADAAERFASLAATEGPRDIPELRDSLLRGAMDGFVSRGDRTRALAIQRELGVVTEYWLAGPFDNERGAAFARELPAERGFDPDATFDGKRHALRWRLLPVREPLRGEIELDELCQPREQFACVLATALVAEQDVDAALWLGCSGGFKVFLNGRQVASADSRREEFTDQDRVPLPLRAGPNLLSITVLIEDGPARINTRLRAADGTVLRGVVASEDRDLLRAAARTTPRELMVPLPPSILDRLLTAAGLGSAGDACRAAMFLLVQRTDDPAMHRDRALAEQAIAGLRSPDHEIALVAAAASFAQRSALAEEKDENRRRALYERILALDPNQAETCQKLADMELDTTGNATRAIALCQQALATNPHYADAHLSMARALSMQGLDLLAEREVFDAARPDPAGRTPLDALLRAAALRRDQSRLADANDLLTRSTLFAGDAPMLRLRAELAERRGDAAGAREAMRDLLAAFPFENGVRGQLASLTEACGDLDGAAAILREAQSLCPDDDAVYVELARLAGRRGDIDQQREMLRAALELNPNRKQETRLLEFLEADQVPFHKAFEIDADAQIAAAGTPPADAAEANDSHFWILRQSVIRAYRNGTRSTFEHQIVRLLGDSSAQRFAQWYVPHDEAEQRARVLSLRVIKADGRELRPTLNGAFARLPPLEAGDIVDVRTRVDDTAPGFFGDYFGLSYPFVPPDGQPCARSDLVLLLDPGREYHFQLSGGAPAPEATVTADGIAVRHFSMNDVPRAHTEDRAPSYAEIAPLLRVTTYADWNAFAGWWWDLVRRESEVTPAIRSKVAELTEGMASDTDRIRAIYRFVTTDVRYKAWEFGVHGYKPYDVATIFERRHGDCKDKALLLDAMLGVVGIEAWPVLIRGEDQRDLDDLALPMVEHFNHCISYLPPHGERPAMFLDGTATLFPIDTVPDMDQGARVLVVHGPRAELLEIPYVDARLNVDSLEMTVELGVDGSGSARLVLEPTRNEGAPLREFLANEPGLRSENVQRMLARWFGQVTVHELKCSDPNDTATPIRLEVAFDGTDLAAPQDDQLALRVAPTARPLQAATSSLTRSLPLLLTTPSTSRSRIVYRLPPGYHVTELPQPLELRESFGGYTLRITTRQGDIVVERERWTTTPRIEPTDYPAFREFAARSDAADARTLVIRKEEQ